MEQISYENCDPLLQTDGVCIFGGKNNKHCAEVKCDNGGYSEHPHLRPQ